MRGRKSKPTALKTLAGNPGKRALNDKEPKPDIVIPACPPHLKGEARAEWDRITKQLYELKIISELDLAALAVCCTAWADYVKACKTLDKEGEVIISDQGGLYQNPWVAIKKRSMDQVQKFYAEFGMTPSSRTRVKVDTPKEGDEMMGFLFGNPAVKVKTKQ